MIDKTQDADAPTPGLDTAQPSLVPLNDAERDALLQELWLSEAAGGASSLSDPESDEEPMVAIHRAHSK